MSSETDTGIYYFIGHITSHILHVLPLWQKLGGTIVVTSTRAKEEVESKYNLPVLCIDTTDTLYRKNIDRIRPRLGLPPRALMLDRSLKRTFTFLEDNARIVIFYELFEFTKYTKLKKPKTLFLAHGSSLKNFFDMYPRRKQIIKDYDYMAGLGPAVKQDFINKGVPAEKIVDIGVARTDELYVAKQQRAKIRNDVINEFKLDPNKPIVGYFTTYWGASSIYGTAAKIIENVSDEYTLLFQLHPQVPSEIREQYDEIIKNKPNIYAVYNNNYPTLTIPRILVASDLLLGDVSSLVLEEVLMDTPMIFCYGEGKYRQSDDDYRNIQGVVDWSEHLDEENTSDTNKVFARALKKGINPVVWKQAKDANFYHYDGTSVKAIVKFVDNIIRLS